MSYECVRCVLLLIDLVRELKPVLQAMDEMMDETRHGDMTHAPSRWQDAWEAIEKAKRYLDENS